VRTNRNFNSGSERVSNLGKIVANPDTTLANAKHFDRCLQHGSVCRRQGAIDALSARQNRKTGDENSCPHVKYLERNLIDVIHRQMGVCTLFLRSGETFTTLHKQ
jgi:hypothetical protein